MRVFKLFTAIIVIATTLLSGHAFAQDEKGKTMATQNKTAMFAGGCFWCMVGPFERLDGVSEVLSGYAGGHVKNPTYEQVSTGRTGHKEVVQITYDPAKVSFDKLIEIFWENVDPFDPDGQFCDQGSQYVAAIFFENDAERAMAEASKAAKEKHLGREIATQIEEKPVFYAAEDYHQNYHKKNELGYKLYRTGCGRDKKLENIWDDARTGHD